MSIIMLYYGNVSSEHECFYLITLSVIFSKIPDIGVCVTDIVAMVVTLQ